MLEFIFESYMHACIHGCMLDCVNVVWRTGGICGRGGDQSSPVWLYSVRQKRAATCHSWKDREGGGGELKRIETMLITVADITILLREEEEGVF